MKKILLLTSVYPGKELNEANTQIVHYFAREWVSQGYNVKVIHNLVYYPKFIHFLIHIFNNAISKVYDFPLPKKQQKTFMHYLIDGVNVYRLPIKKLLPYTLFSRKIQINQLKKIQILLDSMNYIPDVVIGHWANPQLYLVSELKKIYNSQTCIVMHNDVEIINKIYRNRANSVIRSIDIWGFRSLNIEKRFLKLYTKPKKTFLCYSGINLKGLNPPIRKFNKGINKFIFIGLLIPRKHPIEIIKAINNAFEEKNFHITFVGEGPEAKRIKKIAKTLNITDNISVLGRLSRKEVFSLLKTSDCFTMISKPETLGLVYLEAMSMGCITIGSRGEGIDGIIQHGKNGFLSEPGNFQQLSILLTKINQMSAEDLLTISNNAINTMAKLTNTKAAKHYINSVLQKN